MSYQKYEFLGDFLHISEMSNVLRGQVLSRESLSEVSYSQSAQDNHPVDKDRYHRLFGDRAITQPTSKDIPHVSFFGKRDSYFYILEFSTLQEMQKFITEFRDWLSLPNNKSDTLSQQLEDISPNDMHKVLQQTKDHESAMSMFNRKADPQKEDQTIEKKEEKPFQGFDLT